MGKRRFRTVDGVAGILGVACIWLMVRAGAGDFTALHAWAIVVGGFGLAVGFWAMGTCLVARSDARRARRAEKTIERVAERAVATAIQRMVLDELSRPR